MFTKESKSIEEMKKLGGADTIEIFHPKGGKMFFSCGTVSGPISSKNTWEEIKKEPRFFKTITDAEYASELRPEGSECWLLAKSSRIDAF